jgi:CDP-diacylglycerol--glycerol-3-phosphate 3-phosphatidyltransferase
VSTAVKKPLITANHVTFLRLALIPIPCWMLYQGPRGQFWALLLATILGCTDFIDGYLARKYGPTVLGGLMDPIADKVFTAITFLPAVDLGWAPAWMVAALFAREFLVTAARTCYERRGLSLKSSYLARYKTWVQMCGVGILMLLHNASSSTMNILLAIGAVVPLIAFAIRMAIVKKPWKGAAAFAPSFALLLVTHELSNGPEATGLLLMYFIVGVTWASAFGYLLSVGQLRGRGAITAAELIRLGASVVLPCVAVAAQASLALPVWPITTLVSIELAHGGLDNLLAHHKAEMGALGWGARLGLECGLIGYSLFALKHNLPYASGATVVACAIGAVALAVAFIQKRRYYLDSPAPPSLPKAVAPAN